MQHVGNLCESALMRSLWSNEVQSHLVVHIFLFKSKVVKHLCHFAVPHQLPDYCWRNFWISVSILWICSWILNLSNSYESQTDWDIQSQTGCRLILSYCRLDAPKLLSRQQMIVRDHRSCFCLRSCQRQQDQSSASHDVKGSRLCPRSKPRCVSYEQIK